MPAFRIGMGAVASTDSAAIVALVCPCARRAAFFLFTGALECAIERRGHGS